VLWRQNRSWVGDLCYVRKTEQLSPSTTKPTLNEKWSKSIRKSGQLIITLFHTCCRIIFVLGRWCQQPRATSYGELGYSDTVCTVLYITYSQVHGTVTGNLSGCGRLPRYVPAGYRLSTQPVCQALQPLRQNVGRAAPALIRRMVD
jgi:hypothetical protein